MAMVTFLSVVVPVTAWQIITFKKGRESVFHRRLKGWCVSRGVRNGGKYNEILSARTLMLN
jgi:hypothetical protein